METRDLAGFRTAVAPGRRCPVRRGPIADYAAMRLANWLVTAVCGVPVPTSRGPVDRSTYVRRCADGDIPQGLPAVVAGILARHSRAAARMNDHFWRLFDGDIHSEYPDP